jgi:hypothetical protein
VFLILFRQDVTVFCAVVNGFLAFSAVFIGVGCKKIVDGFDIPADGTRRHPICVRHILQIDNLVVQQFGI